MSSADRTQCLALLVHTSIQIVDTTVLGSVLYSIQCYMKTFIHRKYTVDIDSIQICTKDKKKNNTQYTLQHGSG